MEPKAIVYTSNTGHTAQYAQLLSKKSGLPCYDLKEAKSRFSKKEPIIFMGWLIAGFIKDYRRAKKMFDIQAVCAVGLGNSGAQTESVRKANKVPAHVKLYTLQGGIDHDKLTGVYSSMIKTLTKALEMKKDPSDDETAMLALLKKSDNYVSMDNLVGISQEFGWN